MLTSKPLDIGRRLKHETWSFKMANKCVFKSLKIQRASHQIETVQWLLFVSEKNGKIYTYLSKFHAQIPTSDVNIKPSPNTFQKYKATFPAHRIKNKRHHTNIISALTHNEKPTNIKNIFCEGKWVILDISDPRMPKNKPQRFKQTLLVLFNTRGIDLFPRSISSSTIGAQSLSVVLAT